MGRKGIATHWLIFIGMIVGLLIGCAAAAFDCTDLIKRWIEPFGEIFVRLLELIAIPLLFISLIKGIINLQNATRIITIGWRTMVLYLATSTFAVLLGVLLVVTIRPGDLVSEASSKEHFGVLAETASSTIDTAAEFADRSPLQPIVDMVPSNAMGALAGNGTMLQVLILAVILGLAVVSLKGNRVETFRAFVEDIDAILSRCIDMVMYIAPIGIMALMANVVVDTNGDVAVLGALGLYTLTVMLGLGLVAIVLYPLAIMILTKYKVRDYINAVLPVQLMAISTSSSAATLPTTMKAANETLGLPKSVTSFTLPLGVTINMDGSSIYISVTVIFLAQVMNIDLTTAQIITVILTGILASVGTPGIPGGVLITVVMVLGSVGIPVEAIALVLALVRPIDLFVTAVNVTGDVAVSAIVADSLED